MPCDEQRLGPVRDPNRHLAVLAPDRDAVVRRLLAAPPEHAVIVLDGDHGGIVSHEVEALQIRQNQVLKNPASESGYRVIIVVNDDHGGFMATNLKHCKRVVRTFSRTGVVEVTPDGKQSHSIFQVEALQTLRHRQNHNVHRVLVGAYLSGIGHRNLKSNLPRDCVRASCFIA